MTKDERSAKPYTLAEFDSSYPSVEKARLRATAEALEAARADLKATEEMRQDAARRAEEAAYQHRDAMAEVERLTKERDEAQAELAYMIRGYRDVSGERDAAQQEVAEVRSFVASLSEMVQAGAGCCGDAIGRGSRLVQVLEHIDHVTSGKWAETQRDLLSEAWAERDAAQQEVEKLREALREVAEVAQGWPAATIAHAALASSPPGQAGAQTTVGASGAATDCGSTAPEAARSLSAEDVEKLRALVVEALEQLGNPPADVSPLYSADPGHAAAHLREALATIDSALEKP